MYKAIFALLILLVALSVNASVEKLERSIPTYEGDLVLSGNDVLVVENQTLTVEGNIFISGNATLILRNATLLLLQEECFQREIVLANASNGNPRMLLVSSTVTSNHHYYLRLYDNASLVATSSEFDSVYVILLDRSVAVLERTTLINDFGSKVLGKASIEFVNSKANIMLVASSNDNSFVNSSIDAVNAFDTRLHLNGSRVMTLYAENSSVIARGCQFSLSASFVGGDVQITNSSAGILKFEGNVNACAENCTSDVLVISLVNSTGEAASIRVSDGHIALLDERNVTVSSVNLSLRDLLVGKVNFELKGSSKFELYNSSDVFLYALDRSRASLYDSNVSFAVHDDALAFVYWSLAVSVLNPDGSPAQGATVEVSFDNGTTFARGTTDKNGVTFFYLLGKVASSTHEKQLRYHIVARADSYVASAEAVPNAPMKLTMVLQLPSAVDILGVFAALLTTISYVLLRARKKKQQTS